MFTGLSYSGVYSIRHIQSGKEYIGSSGLISKRFKEHIRALDNKYHQNSHLQNAWNKYGKKTFEFKVLIVCDKQHMRDYEQLFINNFAPKFNQSKSAYAGIPLGHTCSEEHKAKVRVTSIEHWGQDKYRNKVTKAIQDSMTDEEKQNRSERAKLLWTNPKYREKSIAVRKGHAWNKGYKCTPEQVENRRKAARISNIKRNYGELWQEEYARRYPEFVGDLNAK